LILMRRILTIIFVVINTIYLHGQDQTLQFNPKYLESPILHSNWYDSSLKVEYITSYNNSLDSSSCLLVNGYADYRIQNPNDYLSKVKNYDVSKIDILFTDYPKRKEDWITNYYELLANRVKELFVIDPSLKTKLIEWKLVLQTDCNTGNKAKKMKHGLIIYFTPKKVTEETLIEEEKDNPEETNIPVKNQPKDSVDIVNVTPTRNTKSFVPAPGDESIIPVHVLQLIPTKEYKPPKRIKNRDEPGCPKFKTRADKPRKRIFRRWFS